MRVSFEFYRLGSLAPEVSACRLWGYRFLTCLSHWAQALHMCQLEEGYQGPGLRLLQNNVQNRREHTVVHSSPVTAFLSSMSSQ